MLSAIGTAAVINPHFTMSEATSKPQSAGISSARDIDRDLAQRVSETDLDIGTQIPTGCSLCHIPHIKLTLPVNGKMKKCAVCK